jgi:hypothetical protein
LHTFPSTHPLLVGNDSFASFSRNQVTTCCFFLTWGKSNQF